jgi:hypothetical protein
MIEMRASLPNGFKLTGRRFFAEAVVENAAGKRRVLVESCRQLRAQWRRFAPTILDLETRRSFISWFSDVRKDKFGSSDAAPLPESRVR